MRTARWTFTFGGAALFAAGCSLINSYDEVKPQAEATGGSASGTGGKGGGGGSAAARCVAAEQDVDRDPLTVEVEFGPAIRAGPA